MAKRITAIVSLVIIAILIVATVVMANVNISYNIKCNAPDEVWIKYTNTSARQVTDEQAKNIVNYINNSSKDKFLTALFNGKVNDRAELVHDSSSELSIPTPTEYYVQYYYNTPQTLKLGGKTYKDENGNTYTYKELWFTVTNANGVSEFRVYVVPAKESITSSNKTTGIYSKYYLLNADFGELYSYLKTI